MPQPPRKSPYLTPDGQIDRAFVVERATVRAKREHAGYLELFGPECGKSFDDCLAEMLGHEMDAALNARQIHFPRPDELVFVSPDAWRSMAHDGPLPTLSR